MADGVLICIALIPFLTGVFNALTQEVTLTRRISDFGWPRFVSAGTASGPGDTVPAQMGSSSIQGPKMDSCRFSSIPPK